MQITRQPNESDKDYMARAFRWSRTCHQAMERRAVRYACNCNQGRLPCTCKPQATRVPLKSLADTGYDMPTQAVSNLTPRRAAWYSAGVTVLSVAVAVIWLVG